MIERFNRTISKILFKLEEVYDTDKFMKSTLIIYNTNQQNNIKITSYFLIYSRTVRLLIEGEVLSRNMLLDRVITLIYKLLLFRKNVRIAIKRVQEKMR